MLWQILTNLLLNNEKECNEIFFWRLGLFIKFNLADINQFEFFHAIQPIIPSQGRFYNLFPSLFCSIYLWAQVTTLVEGSTVQENYWSRDGLTSRL